MKYCLEDITLMCAIGAGITKAEFRIHESVNQASICSDNDLSPDRRQAIIWTNAGILY